MPMNQSSYRKAAFSALFLTCVLSAMPGHTAAEHVTEAQWQQFNIETVDSYISPRYQGFAEQSTQLEKSAGILCKQHTANNLASTRQAYKNSLLAWQSIQNVRFGPVETFMRIFAIQFWPDKKNHTGKQLRQLVASRDPERLTIDAFHSSSVAVRGLPAIERLLFDERALEEIEKEPFRCQVLKGISAYLAENARNIHREWQQEMRPQFADADQLDGFFEDDIDAATALLKTLVEPIEVIKDLKLKRVLGNRLDEVKPKRLESWRSAMSLPNLHANIDSLESMYRGADANKGLSGLLAKATCQKIDQQFAAIQSTLIALSRLPDAEGQALALHESIDTAEGYRLATQLTQQLGTLHDRLESAVSELGIHLGFNSRDGD